MHCISSQWTSLPWRPWGVVCIHGVWCASHGVRNKGVRQGGFMRGMLLFVDVDATPQVQAALH